MTPPLRPAPKPERPLLPLPSERPLPRVPGPPARPSRFVENMTDDTGSSTNPPNPHLESLRLQFIEATDIHSALEASLLNVALRLNNAASALDSYSHNPKLTESAQYKEKLGLNKHHWRLTVQVRDLTGCLADWERKVDRLRKELFEACSMQPPGPRMPKPPPGPPGPSANAAGGRTI